MIQKCQLTNEEFAISESERKTLAQMGLQLPKYSPKMREIMRMAFRNERRLYISKCDATGESMISIFNDNHPFPVYKYEYWISEKWETPQLNYDPTKSFFAQYAELSSKTPRPNAFAPYNENCDYVNAAEKNKNCYMHILSDRCEDCLYTSGIFASKDCIDVAHIYDCELCYECTDCRNCYHCRMCFLCDNSSELSFCYDMRGCRDCFFSYGLRNQQYCFFNKQLTKEQYESELAKLDIGSYATFSKLTQEFQSQIMRNAQYIRLINTENSTGNFLINTKNCQNCYDVSDSEDCSYVRIGANNLRDVHHSHAIVDGSELIMGNVSTTESYNCHNVIGCWTTKDSAYGEFLQGCQNCLGCVSLHYKKHCILNKQYSPGEYAKLKQHIIAELGDNWGGPFPLSIAPFTYYDSAYSDYHTLSQQEVEAIGWRYGQEPPQQQIATTPTSEIPDNISDTTDILLHQTFECIASKKPFKIISQEYKLLKRIGAPLPRKHYEVRHRERTRFRRKAEQKWQAVKTANQSSQ